MPRQEQYLTARMTLQAASLSERVLSYRATVPAFLSDQLQSQLSMCRPAEDDGDTGSQSTCGGTRPSRRIHACSAEARCYAAAAAEPIAAENTELAEVAAVSGMEMRLPTHVPNIAMDETYQKMPAIRCRSLSSSCAHWLAWTRVTWVESR